jgi:hypothetical protein
MPDRYDEATNALCSAISTLVINLLETAHLYQSVNVEEELTAKLSELTNGIRPETRDRDKMFLDAALHGNWSIKTPDAPLGSRRNSASSGLGATLLALRVEIPGARLHCDQCEATQAFNTNKVCELIAGEGDDLPDGHQMLSVHLQCQSCRNTGCSLIVARRGLKLSICGRDPIEHVSLPSFLPKAQLKHFRGARIAFNCGQTLAALFLLRVAIEQFVRAKTGLMQSTKVEEILSAYKATLPGDFRSRFPSLSEQYENLSDAVHAAREDLALFLAVESAIHKHFEARRLYQL